MSLTSFRSQNLRASLPLQKVVNPSTDLHPNRLVEELCKQFEALRPKLLSYTKQLQEQPQRQQKIDLLDTAASNEQVASCTKPQVIVNNVKPRTSVRLQKKAAANNAAPTTISTPKFMQNFKGYEKNIFGANYFC